MKNVLRHGLITAALTFLCTAAGTFVSFASEADGPATGPAVEITTATTAQKPEKAIEPTQGPASGSTDAPVFKEAKAGDYIGEFKATAYCNCPACSSGHTLTYSGTVPKANHTISADINVFPLGTKLLIDGIVYTVEDIGYGVDNNLLDIYFETHEEALDYGLKTVDVYAAE